MGKMMSILEKYKLVEKDEPKTSPVQNKSGENTDVTSSEKVTQPPAPAAEELPPSAESIKEEPIMPKHTSKETTKTTVSEQKAEETASLYDHALSIEEVYSHYSLANAAPTETVFLLENLINALPAELPEFVKKTTLDNIAKASAIDVDKLLTDGERRNAHLEHFINDFTTSNLNDIANLKQEIEQLSALIATYHQQIKYRELLIHEETDLITKESHRINNILEFFKK